MDASITTAELRQSLQGDNPLLIIDVRKAEPFRKASSLVHGALRRDPTRVAEWLRSLPAASSAVVYCVHGHEVSQGVAATLRASGVHARYLAGGIEAWREAGAPMAIKPVDASTRWVTRERPKIDRIACPWLIARFVDPDAEFLYVPADRVARAAGERDAVPYDIPGVEYSHVGEHCSFDAFLRIHRLRDPALDKLAAIVRGADTGRLDLAPQAAGLAALSLGLSRNVPNDHEMLRHGMVLYDALYAWCREDAPEAHTRKPEAYR
jgi:rhodanese-related sulfurtransferase